MTSLLYKESAVSPSRNLHPPLMIVSMSNWDCSSCVARIVSDQQYWFSTLVCLGINNIFSHSSLIPLFDVQQYFFVLSVWIGHFRWTVLHHRFKIKTCNCWTSVYICGCIAMVLEHLLRLSQLMNTNSVGALRPYLNTLKRRIIL